MNKRIMALLAAGAFALIAGVAVAIYMSRADDRAVTGQEPTAVWVVTEDIPRGTTLADAKDKLKHDRVPARSVPVQVVKELPDSKLLAATDIAAGEILLQGRFAEEKLGPEVIAVPAGYMAVSAELTDQARVGSFVRPGDDVAVLFVPKKSGVSYTLLSRVQVLGTGAATEEGGVEDAKGAKGKKVSTKIMTLAVTPAQAAKLAAAAAGDVGELYFGLLPAKTDVKDDLLGSVLPKQFESLLPKALDKVKAQLDLAVSR